MDNLKKLEMQGCRTFVCPNLSIMVEKCKEFNIRDSIIERSKSIAIEYFKKTYHKPHYYSVRHILPGIVYIASILEGDKRSQDDIGKMFGVSKCTVKRWYRDVMKILDIKKLENEGKLGETIIEVDSQFCEIDREGKVLLLKDCTIEMAKYLMSRYFEIENFGHHYSHIRCLRSAFIYTAAIIENDRRTQLEIHQVSGVTECTISKWHHDIIRVLGMKIISHDMRTITVLEGKYDS